jgi:uncharacterized repeat protein (TIGR03803 family)
MAGCEFNEGCGTVFKITPQGDLETLHSFDSADGANPLAGLMQATDGNFYGTTSAGGVHNMGVIFDITPRGTLTTLYSFGSPPEGSNPLAPLLQGTDGAFYGTTVYGGEGDCIFTGCGTVFELTVGLGPFARTIPGAGKIGSEIGILGTALAGTTAVAFDGQAAQFRVYSASLLLAYVPSGATTGYVTVTTPTGVLKSNVPFHVIP